MKTVKIKNLEIGAGLPKIAVPISESSRDAVLGELAKIRTTSADLIEFRADAFPDVENEEKLTSLLNAIRTDSGELPVLFTFRTKAEGGLMELSDESYRDVVACGIKSGAADLIDIELSSPCFDELLTMAHGAGIPVIASKHNFSRTPDGAELLATLKEMEGRGADIAKYACMPAEEGDVETAISTAALAGQTLNVPFLMISMGEKGSVSRVSGQVFGQAVTFGCLPQRASAPGQLDTEELKAEIIRISETRRGKGKQGGLRSDGSFIFLIGFMGTGKTTVARAFARMSDSAGLDIIEMDETIERDAGMSISDIFAQYGQPYFRMLETRLLMNLYDKEAAIVSCGGGVVLKPENVAIMRCLGTIVLLSAEPETLLERLLGEAENRPNIRDKMSIEGISGLLGARRPFYEEAADIVIRTDGKPAATIASEILSKLDIARK